MKIGFLTYKNFQVDHNDREYVSKEYPGLTNSDNHVRKFIEKNKVKCEALAWDDNLTDTSSFDMFVIRSTWNYYHSKDNFNKFLEFIHKIRLKVYNVEIIIKWNANKKYLKDLNEKGIPIVPTIFLDNINELMPINLKNMKENTGEVIIKPCISGSAHNTYKVNPAKISDEELSYIKHNFKQTGMTEVMIQPFITSILEAGEISLIFFKDKLSHAVRKIPTVENFCSHSIVSSLNCISAQALAIAKEALLATYTILNLPISSLLYARVDLLFDNERGYLLSELELIEPDLFLQYKENSAIDFGNAILNSIK